MSWKSKHLLNGGDYYVIFLALSTLEMKREELVLSGEYAKVGGVDYTKLQGFKDMMVEVVKQTRHFPNKRDVLMVNLVHSHGAAWYYIGTGRHIWCNTVEGLGNKNWIAEWMYAFGDRKSHYDEVAFCNIMMAVNDVIAQGAMPVEYGDEVAAGTSDWFADKMRAADFARGTFLACEAAGMALGSGESPALKYLVRSAPPIEGGVPVLSGSVIGIINPASNLITGEKLRAGDHILAVKSSGMHSNGSGLVIGKALELPDQFNTVLPNGKTLGAEVLTPTMCYVNLIEKLLSEHVEIHALLPGTGDGIAKLSFDKRPFTYRVHTWFDEIPILFRFMHEVVGVSFVDCITTFNWGAGYYFYLPQKEVEKAITVGTNAGYEVIEVGIVEEGERKTIFGPAGDLVLPPPGE